MEEQQERKKCPFCGGEILSTVAKCKHCGEFVNKEYIATNGKSKVAAALLAFFIGGFGVHMFYVGRTKAGVLYLIFCWTYIPALLALIDFIFILCGKFKDKNGNIMWS